MYNETPSSTTLNTTVYPGNDCEPILIYGIEEPPVSKEVLWVAVVHSCCVIIIGTIGNAVALWCVAKCTKTRMAVKVLLFSIFLPALLVCLVTRPVTTQFQVALLTCDNTLSKNKTILKIAIVLYSILAQTELASISAVAVVRTVSVWAPQIQKLGLRSAVFIVSGIFLYSVLTGLTMVGLEMNDEMENSWTLITIFFFLNTTIPALVTAVAYLCLICVIQRNKRRVALNQSIDQESTLTIDQATRAMLAVFISNLVFGIPHSIFHLMGKQPLQMYIIFHILFCTHFVVDPLAFVWFNSFYRKRVSTRICEVTQTLSSISTSILFSTPTSSTVSPSYQPNQEQSINKEYCPN